MKSKAADWGSCPCVSLLLHLCCQAPLTSVVSLQTWGKQLGVSATQSLCGSARLLAAAPVGVSPQNRLTQLPEVDATSGTAHLSPCGWLRIVDRFMHVRRSKEQFVTEIAEVDYIFGPASKPFLEGIVKTGQTFTFVQAVIYTPQVLPSSLCLAWMSLRAAHTMAARLTSARLSVHCMAAGACLPSHLGPTAWHMLP